MSEICIHNTGVPRIHKLQGASPHGPTPGLCPGPIGGLKAAPKPPASLGFHIKNTLATPLNVPVQAPTRDQPFTVIPRNRPISIAFYDAHGDMEDILTIICFYSSYDLARAYELCILVKMTIMTAWTVNYHQAVIKIKSFIDILIVIIRRKSLKYMYIANFEIIPPPPPHWQERKGDFPLPPTSLDRNLTCQPRRSGHSGQKCASISPPFISSPLVTNCTSLEVYKSKLGRSPSGVLLWKALR